MFLISFIVYTAFCYWVIFRDGADSIEGWKSFFIFSWFAATLTTPELKFYVGISWIVSLALLLYHLLSGQGAEA